MYHPGRLIIVVVPPEFALYDNLFSYTSLLDDNGVSRTGLGSL